MLQVGIDMYIFESYVSLNVIDILQIVLHKS